MIWATGVSCEGEMSFIQHTCSFNNQCPGFQPLSISVMDRPSLLSLPKPQPRLEQRIFPKWRKYPWRKADQTTTQRRFFFLPFFFLLLFLKALSSNKQLFQSAALIKRNVLISPRQNIMLLCYHWSKSSKIQNKNIGLIRSRSGMSWRNLPSSQVCPILRKKRGIKARGLALGRVWLSGQKCRDQNWPSPITANKPLKTLSLTPGMFWLIFFLNWQIIWKSLNLCFHLLWSKPTGRAVGTPTRSLLPPNRGSGWWGMHPLGFPEASKFWRGFSHREPEQGLDPTRGDGNRQQMQEHPCPASLMRDG